MTNKLFHHKMYGPNRNLEEQIINTRRNPMMPARKIEYNRQWQALKHQPHAHMSTWVDIMKTKQTYNHLPNKCMTAWYMNTYTTTPNRQSKNKNLRSTSHIHCGDACCNANNWVLTLGQVFV